MKNGSGIVIEVNNKKATLLMRDGTFVTVKVPAGKRPLVGKEYQASYFSQRKRSLFVVPSLSISVAALIGFLFLSGLVPTSSQSAAAAYVSFDINPSLEVGINDEMRVVEIEAFNKEAKKILDKYDLSADQNLTFEKFADRLIKAYEEEGYMKSDQSMLITTVSDKSSSEETEKAINQAVDSIVKKTVVKYPVAITVSETNQDTREKAKDLGISSGKYTAYQKATKHGKPLNKEKIKDVKFQELKMNIASSSDIKVVPHPRKINPSNDEVKKEKHPVKKKEVKFIQKNHDHKEHHSNKQQKVIEPQKAKIINIDDKRNQRNNVRVKHDHSQKNDKKNDNGRKEFNRKVLKEDRKENDHRQKRHDKREHKH